MKLPGLAFPTPDLRLEQQNEREEETVNGPDASLQGAFALKEQGRSLFSRGDLAEASQCFMQSYLVASECGF
jgi:hypothetical protein